MNKINSIIIMEALKHYGEKEIPGTDDNEKITEYLNSVEHGFGDVHDEVPWCSGFVNYITKNLGLPWTNSLLALSWSNTGKPINIKLAHPGDVIVFNYGNGRGHVAFFIRYVDHPVNPHVWCLGGNQRNQVNITKFKTARIQTIRRLDYV